jgi:hypothetical protein
MIHRLPEIAFVLLVLISVIAAIRGVMYVGQKYGE